MHTSNTKALPSSWHLICPLASCLLRFTIYNCRRISKRRQAQQLSYAHWTDIDDRVSVANLLQVPTHARQTVCYTSNILTPTPQQTQSARKIAQKNTFSCSSIVKTLLCKQHYYNSIQPSDKPHTLKIILWYMRLWYTDCLKRWRPCFQVPFALDVGTESTTFWSSVNQKTS